MKILRGVLGIAVVLAMAEISYSQSFLTNGLVAHYKFDGNSNDSSGNGYNGTKIQATYGANRFGQNNSALCLNGTNSVFEVTSLPALSSNFTYSAWVKVSGENHDSNPNQSFGVYGFPNVMWNFCYNMDGSFNVWDNINQTWEVATGSHNPIYSWAHVAIVYAPAGIEYLFINGTLSGSRQVGLPISNSGGTNFFIGAIDGDQSQSFNGCVDDVRIYDHALSSNEVFMLYAIESNYTNPPTITQQPTDINANAHSNITFTVSATEFTPAFFQWQFNNSNLVNETNSTLTVTNVKQFNLGQYLVLITNAFGSVTSSVANLYMYPFLSQPFNGKVTYWGQSNTLSVGAWGSGNLAFQWYFNGVALAGATNFSLPLGAIQFTNAGQYSVIVSNSLGSITNSPYQVIVNPANVSLAMTPTVVIQGTIGYKYYVESTTDLGDTNSWLSETNLTLTQPIQNWYDSNVDASKPGHPQKFYRVEPGQ